jgi:hypothetical protein
MTPPTPSTIHLRTSSCRVDRSDGGQPGAHAASTSRRGRGILAPGEDQAGLPPRGTASRRWMDPVHVVAAARERPGHRGVRVSHLSCPELIPAPGQGRDLSQDGEKGYRLRDVVGRAHRTLDRFSDVWDASIAPAAKLVAKGGETAQQPRANRPFHENTTVGVCNVPHRSHLDRITNASETDHQPAVVQIRRLAVLSTGRPPLVEPTVPTHHVTTGSQRQPVQINPCLASLSVHCLTPDQQNMDRGAGPGSKVTAPPCAPRSRTTGRPSVL